jgi:DNA-binding SARP family transcriptional activator/tetratricopeptide (TPR) repeat protein
MKMHVLGPLEIRGPGGAALPLGTRKQQAVLAVLAVSANRVVELDELIDEVWPEHPPASAVANVRSYTANLRRLFESAEQGSGRLVRKGSGYLLHAGPDELDLLAFTAEHAAALRCDDPATAAQRLAKVLAYWRGAMLAGLPRGPLLDARCTAVEDERLSAREELAELQLRLGNPGRAVALLTEHLPAHRLRERAYGILMRALAESGDVPRALRQYRDLRTALVEELGIEPGPELQELHRTILAGEGVSPAPTWAAPAQLPAASAAFTGRGAQLRRLDALLPAAGNPAPPAVVISALSGMAGVGKTALAVHWAHRVRDRFPDGQLYVNLHGFDPSAPPLSPAEAVRGFLDALQVPTSRIPATVEAQVSLYRSLLADRRVLVVLDNARDAEQVRPLLPGAAGCLVLVTSRNQLSGLVAAEGAHLLPLDLPSAAEARELLARRLGADRVAAEPAAVEEIVERCARLPLALAVVAARAATNPTFRLAAVAAELRSNASRLEVFDGGDPATDVRTVFSWSYEILGAPAARLFRLLGLHPGQDFSIAAAASLVGAPVEETRRLLAELARAHLVTEHVPGRYTLHDLLRAYASSLAHAIDGDLDRAAATGRMLDCYLHTGYTADQQINQYRYWTPITLHPPRPGAVVEAIADPKSAMAWFTAEHRVLLATVHHAARTGFDTHVWQLTWTMATFLRRRGLWQEWADTQRAALPAATRLADRTALAHVHRQLGWAYMELGRLDDARAHLEQAFGLFGELGDHGNQAGINQSLGLVLDRQGQHAEALRHAHQSLELFRLVGHRPGEARALNNIGWTYAKLGKYQQTLVYCEQALDLQRELGDREAEGNTLDSVAYAHRRLGHNSEAIAYYNQCLALERETGDRYLQAETLTDIGDTWYEAGDPDAARHAWQEAGTILRELGHPNAEQVQTRLDSLDRPDRGRALPMPSLR